MTYPSRQVVDLASKLVALKISTDEKTGRTAASRYGVDAVPAIVFVDSKGRRLHSFVGFKAPGAFAQEMQKALRRPRR